MKRGADIFQTVKTEGAILPSDLLRRLADGDQDIAGLRPEDYHLAKSERINEASTRAWNRLQGVWEGLKNAIEALSESDIGTSLTRERWLLILFQELGYGRLTTCKAYEIEGKTYPISHQWQNTPIHLVSFRQDLDKRTPGRAGAARISPHSLVQEFLNRSDDHLWGFVSNGLNLRLLRDNVSLTRQAYIEFDLQAMMDSDAYSDFFLLYLLCHQSRVEVPEGKSPAHCWLEKWYNMAAQQGVRALDQLRDGVQTAIEVLGGGFLAYPSNTALREKLRSGELTTQDYYHQVLRQIYRLLFLFVAEDRDLLLYSESPTGARKLYLDHYSTKRLRTLAERTRGTRHPDLWCALRLVLDRLYHGCPHLALPALGSFLFSRDATPDLNDLEIANKDLLKAIRALAFTVDRNVLRLVNYRNLGPEELGSVYESLLEMHPTIVIEATNPEQRFRLTVAAGSERKTTGSYYTPTSLVNCLLDSALDPVLDEACKKPDPEKAILALNVCDPACGSGHFLIAAAHRIAKRLAAIQADEDEPSPQHYQHALREVISRCIYGVDINPMSVELCKVSLWMEAMEPGKPLAFLDHHIKCGNSLFGTTPALLKRGIPDDAFKPIEGDDKEFCKKWKNENKKERVGFVDLIGAHRDPWERIGNLGAALMDIEDVDDSSIQGLHDKERAYADFVQSSGYLTGKFLYDAWCASYVWRKLETAQLPYPITQDIIFRIEENPHNCPHWMREEIIRLTREYRFFHWHLEFPDVFKPKASDEIAEDDVTGWFGGFVCILGNPPWEKVKIQEREWFAATHPEIANAKTAALRRKKIQALALDESETFASYLAAKRSAEATTLFFQTSGKFPLGAEGDLNTYPLFTELAEAVIRPEGRAGIIVKTGIIADYSMRHFFAHFTDDRRLISAYDFSNKKLIFPAVVANERFTLLTLIGSRGNDHPACISILNESVDELKEEGRVWSLTSEDVLRINPNTKTCPLFQTEREALIVKRIYKSHPILMQESYPEPRNPWSVDYFRAFDMTNDSGFFVDQEDVESRFATTAAPQIGTDNNSLVAVIEGKLFDIFNHRHGTFEGIPRSRRFGIKAESNHPDSTQLRDPFFQCLPRYWLPKQESSRRFYERLSFVPSGVLTFRDVCRTHTDLRTVRAAIYPPYAAGNKAPLLLFKDCDARKSAIRSLRLCGILDSFVFDFVARQKFAGGSLNRYILVQLPVIPPESLINPWHANTLKRSWIESRILELTYTSWDLEMFARDCGYNGPPFIWDEERRFLIRAELDAAFLHLYLGTEQEWREKGTQELLEYFPTPREAIDYILETFTIFKRKDEQIHNTYRTKDTILEIYDEMAKAVQENNAAIAMGQQPIARYQARLNPPPGPPMDAEGNFIPMANWDRTNWPPHIHPPSESDTKGKAHFGACGNA